MSLSLYNLMLGVAALIIAVIVVYSLVTALAYGIARSVLQAKKDHETGKETRHESK